MKTAMIQECEWVYKYLLVYHMIKLEKTDTFLATENMANMFLSGLEAIISSLGTGKNCPEFDLAILILEPLVTKQKPKKPNQNIKKFLKSWLSVLK